MKKIDFDSYDTAGFYDEMFSERTKTREQYQLFKERIEKIGWKKLKMLQHSTDRVQLSLGMTFNVYNENEGVERILPLDLIPRIIPSEEWSLLEKGLEQRIIALNLFIDDIYHHKD